jgi:caffeoyl-CoA O-methyltransferase
MIQLVDQALEDYARAYSTPVPELFEKLREHTHAHTDLPQMQVGPLEGMFLKVMARICGAKRIVEVGTFTGYSTLMMASALPDDGELITCELSDKHADIAQSFFDRSPHGRKIRIARGPAAETLAALEGPFDMAFIDADKGGYITYFDLLLPRMRPNGLIVADNVLWSGRVLEGPDKADEDTKAIQAFNQHIKNHQESEQIMVTVRDGMTLIVV